MCYSNQEFCAGIWFRTSLRILVCHSVGSVRVLRSGQAVRQQGGAGLDFGRTESRRHVRAAVARSGDVSVGL